ncbi:MAG: YdcF family protein [Acidimicrobiia bacterium]|nr:YdcF family protein [Acidimicrobiia bacterium]MBP8181705.1 YdcF family protein [Acidimicrobiia bacterium]
MSRRRKLTIGAFVLLIGYFAANFFAVLWAARTDGAAPADAIVVMGAAQYNGHPSSVLQARLDHAAELYQEGIADTVVVTGGRQEGDAYSEAQASANTLATLGVPQDAVIREDRGSNSWQSLQEVDKIAEENGWDRVVIVSDGFHLERLKEISDELGLGAVTSPVPNSPISGVSELRSLLRESAYVSIGRIVGFRRLERL